MQTTEAPVRGTTSRPTERALAPDLARGGMLLFIAMAHGTGTALSATPGLEPEPTGVEGPVNMFLLSFVHARSFPLFALMFGYGIVQLARRQERAGVDRRGARAILLRRSAALLALGALHGTLLLSGDILGAYGILGLVFTLTLLNRSDRVHRLAPWYLALAGAVIAAYAFFTLSAWGPGDSGVPFRADPAPKPETYGEFVGENVAHWPVQTLMFLSLIFMVWIGAWAARHRILENPAPHKRRLQTVAAGGLAVSVLGALPMSLLSAGLATTNKEAASWARMLYETTGTFGGLAYAAIFALLALRIGQRRGPVVNAVAALGQRSLSGYLFQSFAWLALTMPFAIDLAERSDSPLLVGLVCGIGVWLVTLTGAELLRRKRLRGPAEALLRRVTYGRARL
ncbi:DUF418 domain-containing protein [Salininema proteolyticum]|uniref:DUF418 domain-containing protein n=1 Tax=Salininema proteolyticum TaxID=1607685 RepID=A0ABV8U1Y2_9ACTN